MKREDWDRVEELFQAALDREPGEREIFLHDACQGLPELHREVDSLLDSFTGAADVVGSAVSRAAQSLEQATPAAGRRIGIYEVVRELGRGGMGQVLLAERADGTYRQQVAIKLVKRGMDTDLLLSRFRQERQILASLEHPNIARLLDGGSTEDGRPYLVMEYIEGESIAAYADHHQLTERRRLELFGQVCSAVQFAHQHLVVHRDLKPGNILVTGDGVPKLLDFGVAKLLRSQTEDDDGASTFASLRAMTPQYASPEQVEGGSITTATDVYALGAILYELISGEKAHPLQSFTDEEIRRVVCSDEAGARTRKRLGGDLDNVVHMAMRKEPQRRYASAEQLSTDICRYLDGLPVLAHKDSWRYRLGKFLARNKLAVAAALLLVASLAAGMAATMRQARIAERERNRAYSMLHFLQQVVGAADAESTFPVRLRADATLADLMDAAAKGLNSFTSDAMAEAVLRTTIGNAYRTMGKWDKAETQLNRAYAIQKGGAEPVEERVPVLRALAQLAFRKGDLQRAKEMDLEALRIWDGMGAAADQKAKLGVVTEIGTIFLQTDQPKEALPFLLRAQEIIRANPGMDPAWVVSATGALARAWGNLGEREKAEPLYREAIAKGEKMGWPPPNSLSAHMHNLAILIRATNPEEAENWLRRTVEMRTALYGAENSVTLSSAVELELTRARSGKVAEAELALRKALEVERRTLPAGHYETQRTLRALGETLRLEGKYREAEAVLREALQARLKIYGADSAMVADTQAELAMAVAGLGRNEEAKTMLEQALAILTKRFSAGHPSRAAVEEKLRKIAGE